MTDRELMQMALDAFDTCIIYDEADAWFDIDRVSGAAEALRKRLAHYEREWIGLTDDDFAKCKSDEFVVFAREIEAKLKEKNT